MKILRDFLGVFAVLIAVGVIASFCFLPVASVKTVDAKGSEDTTEVTALELAFGTDLSTDLGYETEDTIITYKSGWYTISFLLAAAMVLFTVLGFKFMKSYGAAVLVGLINSIILLVVAVSSPTAYADFGRVAVKSADLGWEIFLVFGLTVGSTAIASVAALAKDKVLCAASGKKTIPQRVVQFLREYKSEIKKIVWPGPKNVVKNTLVVLAVCAVVLLIVWLVDLGMGELFKLVFDNSAEATSSTVA